MTPAEAPLRAPMRTVHLRLWMPLVLVASCALIFLILVGLEQRNHAQELQHFINRTAHEELLHTRRNLEAILRRGDGGSLDNAMSDLGLNPAVTHAVLTDETGMVLTATRFAWRNEFAKAVVPGYAPQDSAQVLQTQHEALQLDVSGRRLTAIAPVAMALRPGEIRANRQGALTIVYDLTPIDARAWASILWQAQVFAAVTLLAAIGLLGLAHWGILRPIAALRAGMARIGAGDFLALPQWKGHGEFQELGQALERMAHQLQTGNQALAESEARYRQLSDAAFEAIILHEGGHIRDANAVADRLMGVPPGGMVGTRLLSWVAPHDVDTTRQRIALGLQGIWEVDLQDAQGTPIPCECSVQQRDIDGRTIRTVAVRDLRQRLAAEAEIRQLAHFDVLTGLCNRRLLLEQLALELQEVERLPRRASLAALNLNAFQAVNDSLGMAAGDTVLRAIARRLSALLEQGQTLARVDGDTFAVLMTELGGDLEAASAQAARSIERLLAAINEPIEVEGQTLHLSAGAGLVMIPNDSRDPPELLREAETAMHQAKEAGDSRVRFFAHALQEAASARLALRNDLRSALRTSAHGVQEQALRLHYQPQVNAQGQLLGVEALVRWQHPARGLIPPGHFIAEAEANGLIVPLGNWVLEEAASCLRRWQTDAQTQPWAQPLSMAVNVSPRQFREPDFVARIEDVLARVGIQALSLELELTENVVADDLEATLEKIELLRRHGVRFALDDFGTGYSSLAYLKRLPIDTLKIDRSFVMDIDAPDQTGPGKRPAVLIDAIVAMAHQLDLHVLAEGVETETQLARLVQVGCDSFQGYYFSRPLPEADLRAWACLRGR